jgi:hypothetical protein
MSSNFYAAFALVACMGCYSVGFLVGRIPDKQTAPVVAPAASVSIPASSAPGFILVHQRNEPVYLAVSKLVTFSKYADGTRLDLMDGSVVMVGEGVEVIVLMLQNAGKP